MVRILIIEDNIKLAQYTKEALENEGYAVDAVYDGETGERRAKSGSYDLILLDVMLPKKDGIEIAKSLRKSSMMKPIIMVTAKGELDDKILGLDSGADDYLVKPFEIKELIARTRALLRRPEIHLGEKLAAHDLSLESATQSVIKGKKIILLTRKEYSLLEYLMLHKGMVVTREQLLEHCWDFAFESFSNIVDVYIKELRKKLSDDSTKYIKTIRGTGYMFRT